jgi:hypothetical protein
MAGSHTKHDGGVGNAPWSSRVVAETQVLDCSFANASGPLAVGRLLFEPSLGNTLGGSSETSDKSFTSLRDQVLGFSAARHCWSDMDGLGGATEVYFIC